jgi:hypothetical protein
MGFAELVLFIKSLPEMVKVLGNIHDTLKQLRQESIDRELAQIRKDVSITLNQIDGAKTNEERKKLALDLVNRISK